MNRMIEALGVFKTVISHGAFKKVPFLLFLNKKDLFEEKISTSKVQDQKEFADYSGDSYDEATEYFKQKFVYCFENNEDLRNRLFVHSTEATNTVWIYF